MKICIVFGHHNTKDSFNASVRDTFIDEAKKVGHEIDLINLFDEEEQLPFYRSDINPPPKLVIDYNSIVSFADPSANFGLILQKNKIQKKVNKKLEESESKKNNIINFSNYKKN